MNCTGRPSVATLAKSRPIRIGKINVLGCEVDLLMCECETLSSANNHEFVIFPARCSHQEAREILIQADWLHVANKVIPERIQTRFIAQYQERCDSLIRRAEYNRKNRLTKRQATARIARQLIRVNNVHLEDSRRAGNCWPGTVQFCNSLGLEIPGRWSKTYAVDSRVILRAWRARGYVANNLFFDAINAAEKRYQQELINDNEYRLDLCHSL